MTFAGERPGTETTSVAPQPDAISLGMHQTFVRLPVLQPIVVVPDCSSSNESSARPVDAPGMRSRRSRR